MARKQRTRAGRILSICAWASMVVLGVWEIKVKDHGAPGFGPLFQIAVALIAAFSETMGLLQEPR